MAKLVLLNGDRAGQEFPLESGRTYVLGRGDGCDIVLRNIPGVSRRHAEFVENDGRWMVHDLGSQNGIYFKKERVESRVLEDHDALWFSNASFRFESGDADPGKKNVYFKQTVKSNGDAADETQSGKDVNIRDPEPMSDTKKPSAAASSSSNAGDVNLKQIKEIREQYTAIEQEFAKAVVGRREVLNLLLSALLADGHCLLVGPSGVGKTHIATTLARILGLRTNCIAFTPDLAPADIIGSEIIELDTDCGKTLRLIEGPVFTNVLVADEFDRAAPRTQAAVLSMMQDRQVCVSKQTFQLPRPFFVVATQDPFDLDAASAPSAGQLDHFLFKVAVDYLSASEEKELVKQTASRKVGDVKEVLNREQVLHLQELVAEVPVSGRVIDCATQLVRSTRPSDDSAEDCCKKYLSRGAGPRAAQAMVHGAKVRAILAGRFAAGNEDVMAVAPAVLRHRLAVNAAAAADRIRVEDVITQLLETHRE